MTAAAPVEIAPPRLPPTRSGIESAWWRDAVIYELYIRSFADGNGDGIGDLAGVRSRLPYLADLGIDAIWFTPWYARRWPTVATTSRTTARSTRRSGRSRRRRQLIAEAAALGIRTIVDVVPNHVSDQHPWFQAALAPPPGSAERARFWFHAGRGPHGDEMPTGWPSNFSGPVVDAHHEPRRHAQASGTCTCSRRRSPTSTGTIRTSVAKHEEILRFWLDRGAAGIRIDSAALLVKDPTLPEVPSEPGPGEHPNTDRDELHDIYRSWRAIADEYPGTRILVGELWLPDAERFAMYLRPGELHTAFNFDFMSRPWDASGMRDSIDATLAAHAPVRAPATWLVSNHDVTRPVTRYGQEDSSFAFVRKRRGTPTDLAPGTASGARRRPPGRRAAGFALHLPGR